LYMSYHFFPINRLTFTHPYMCTYLPESTIMFKNRKHKFYYGDGTDNVVSLTEKQALAVNSFKFYPVDSQESNVNRIRGHVELAAGCTLKYFNYATTILNNYLADYVILYNESEKSLLRHVIFRKKLF